MSSELKLVINDFISVNHYLQYTIVKKGKRYIPSSHKTKEAVDFKTNFSNYVKNEVNKQGWVLDPNPFQHYYVDAVFYFPRVDMDTNNYWKVAFDAITESGVVWLDDNMACERVTKVMYDSNNPRIEYTIYKTDFVGIFNNSDELNSFEDKCHTCKRYKRNCSILRKAKEGRIQEEIGIDLSCNKYNKKID